MSKKPARKHQATSLTESPELDSGVEEAKPETRTPRVFSGFDRRRVTAPKHDPEIHGPSMVQQHFKDECDINRIILRFTETGMVSHTNPNPPSFGDAPATTFDEAMFLIKEAQDQFDDLPAEIRAHFQNDPGQFVAAFEDADRREELTELGLIRPEEKPEAVLVRLEDQPMPGNKTAENVAES